MMLSAKVKHAVMLGLLFFVVSSPYTYKLVDSLVGHFVGSLFPSVAHLFKIAEGGCPTTYGLAVHSAVFALVAYYLHNA
jgi:hypothetical protein